MRFLHYHVLLTTHILLWATVKSIRHSAFNFWPLSTTGWLSTFIKTRIKYVLTTFTIGKEGSVGKRSVGECDRVAEGSFWRLHCALERLSQLKKWALVWLPQSPPLGRFVVSFSSPECIFLLHMHIGLSFRCIAFHLSHILSLPLNPAGGVMGWECHSRKAGYDV